MLLTTNNDTSSKKKPTHYCKHHGPNFLHNTEECNALKNSKSEGTNCSNKTWSRKAEEEKSKSKKELATLIAKAVNKGVKRQLASLDKKRKSDSDEEDGDCFLLNTLTSNLDGFNYEDMEKLSVDDGDEISV